MTICITNSYLQLHFLVFHVVKLLLFVSFLRISLERRNDFLAIVIISFDVVLYSFSDCPIPGHFFACIEALGIKDIIAVIRTT